MLHNEPFIVYRQVLFIALAVYYGVTTVVTGWQVAALLRGHEPQKRLLRVYLSYQLLTLRLRPSWRELVQIGGWTVILLVLWWLHGKV